MKRLLAIIVIVALAVVLGLYGVGGVLTRPVQQIIGEAPADLMARSVRFPSTAGETIVGWQVDGSPEKAIVLLLHGVRSSRLQMVPRARWLRSDGYGVLLIDLPGHGESHSDRIAFGFNESRAVEGALDYLAGVFPGRRVVIIGVSLGAASAVLARNYDSVKAIVLESMYPTIAMATENRLAMRLGGWGRYLAPLLWRQIPWRLDFPVDALRPVDRMAELSVPVMVISGVEDRHTTRSDTMMLFESAREPRNLWLVEGVGHVDLFDAVQPEYQYKVGSFLSRYSSHHPGL